LTDKIAVYLEEFKQVYEEARLYMRKAYWLVFYYLVIVFAMASVVVTGDKSLNSFSLEGVGIASAIAGSTYLYYILLLLPIINAAVIFFGMFWQFHEFRANAYLGWLSVRLHAALRDADGPPRWQNLDYYARWRDTMKLRQASLKTCERNLAFFFDMSSNLLAGCFAAVPLVLSLVILVEFSCVPALRRPGAMPLLVIGWLVTALVLLYGIGCLAYGAKYKKIDPAEIPPGTHTDTGHHDATAAAIAQTGLSLDAAGKSLDVVGKSLESVGSSLETVAGSLGTLAEVLDAEDE